MTTNTGNGNVEQLKTLIDIAKQEAGLAEDLSDQTENPDNQEGILSKEATEKEKQTKAEQEKKEKEEKAETIAIKSLKELPAVDLPYKRNGKKSYKISFPDASYEFFGDGKVIITKGEK
jgi:hypothetical protein